MSTSTTPTPKDLADKNTPPAPDANTPPAGEETPASTAGVDFPLETKRSDMTPEQQSAYDRHQALKNSKAAKQHAKDKEAAEKRAAAAEAELEQLRRSHLSDDERKSAEAVEAEVQKRVQEAVVASQAEEAKKRRERALSSLPAELRRANPALTAEQAEQHAEMLNLDVLLTEDGYLDSEAVSKAALPGIVVGGPSHRQAYVSTQGGTPPGTPDINDEVAKRRAEMAEKRKARS